MLRSDILYDCGNSLNPVIDVGQAEGAFVMGQGYFMQEEILQGFDGVLASEDTWEHEPGLLTCQLRGGGSAGPSRPPDLTIP